MKSLISLNSGTGKTVWNFITLLNSKVPTLLNPRANRTRYNYLPSVFSIVAYQRIDSRQEVSDQKARCQRMINQ